MSLLVASAPLGAQTPAVRFEHLSVENGLSHSAVLDIAQDRHGFLWFATPRGLNRYDGYRFRIFRHDPEDGASLSDNTVWRLLADRRGELWIGTSKGLNRFQREDERFVRYRHDPEDPRSLSHDSVLGLYEDHTGSLWIATYGGLNRLAADGTFDRYLHRPGDEESLGDSRVGALAEDRQGRLWVGTYGGLHLFDRRSETFRHFRHDDADPRSLSDDLVNEITADADGYLWIGTAKGLNRFDPQSETFTPYRPASLDVAGERIFEIRQDREGDLWVGTLNAGLIRIPRDGGPPTQYRHDGSDPWSLNGDHIYSIFEDASGILWFSTWVGLNKYNRRLEQFPIYRQEPSRRPTLTDSNISAILEDRSGTLWVGTWEKGLNRLDRERGTVVHYLPDSEDPRSLPDDTVQGLCEDRSGTLWVATWGGLARFDRESGSFTTYRPDPGDPSSLDSDAVMSVYEDRRGRLWVGTIFGASRFDPATDGFIRYQVGEGIDAMLEDRAGTLWFGSAGGGLLYLEPGLAAESRDLARLRHDPDDDSSLASDAVNALHEDGSGRLWIGTGEGLDRLDPARERFSHYREEDGLAANQVVGILEDDAGRLWLSTSNGLSRFDPRTGEFRNFGVEDGLQSDVFSHRSAFRSSKGEMFFGGIHGFNAFFPDRIRPDPYVPPVVLTDFQLFNESVLPRRIDPGSPLERSILETAAIRLSHRHDVFSLEFAALHYASPKKNRYAYRLEGFDGDWIETDADKRFATYTNLDAGTYRFRVRGANPSGVWNEEEARLEIVVAPAPWKSWWAFTLYGLALSAGVLAAVRSQAHKLEQERAVSRRLREVDKLKDEFLANTSHELRTPLYGMTGLAESLIDGGAGEVSPAVRSNLAMIVASGRRLAHLINDILDFSKLKHKSLDLARKPVDLRALTDVVLALLRPLVGPKDLELVNAVGADLPAALADENRLHQILHNLVGNAIKFTESGRVEVAASVRGEEISVRVEDTGVGIPEDRLERIFEAFEQADSSAEREFGGTGLGLAVTLQLVKLHGGTLYVESTPGEGSTFFFTLPVARTAPEAPSPALAASTVAAVVPGAEPAPAPMESARENAASILVVDDEPVIRQVLVNQLAAEGYQIRQATSGPEALASLDQRPADLVLLDVMMPRMSGYEVCRTLRDRHPLDELPVILLTAKNQVEDLVVGLAAGANDYLPKPISKSELVARVKTHLALLTVNRKLSWLVKERTTQVEERDRLLREREKLIGELEQRNAELARFNYAVSHDLKNPLVTIKNYLGLLRQDAQADQKERLAHDLDWLEKAADKLHRLLEELFEFSRAGIQANPPEEVAFGELVSEALAPMGDAISQRGVRVEIAEGLPVVRGDRRWLRELVRHLLQNAIQYLQDQTAPRIEIGARSDGAETVFYVHDNGRGIDPRYHDRVFGLFERLDAETSERTGIGLALVKRIVEAHGGRIWVESRGVGSGSSFCFTLGEGRVSSEGESEITVEAGRLDP